MSKIVMMMVISEFARSSDRATFPFEVDAGRLKMQVGRSFSFVCVCEFLMG